MFLEKCFFVGAQNDCACGPELCAVNKKRLLIMKTIEGYDVKIFTDNIEESALTQIMQLLSIDLFPQRRYG